MKHIPTKEQVLDALQTHKTLYRAAYKFGVTTPTLKKWMRHYGIVANHNVKVTEEERVQIYDDLRHVPTIEEMEERHLRAKSLYEQDAEKHKSSQRLPWYKRLFKKGK